MCTGRNQFDNQFSKDYQSSIIDEKLIFHQNNGFHEIKSFLIQTKIKSSNFKGWQIDQLLSKYHENVMHNLNAKFKEFLKLSLKKAYTANATKRHSDKAAGILKYKKNGRNREITMMNSGNIFLQPKLFGIIWNTIWFSIKITLII